MGNRSSKNKNQYQKLTDKDFQFLLYSIPNELSTYKKCTETGLHDLSKKLLHDKFIFCLDWRGLPVKMWKSDDEVFIEITRKIKKGDDFHKQYCIFKLQDLNKNDLLEIFM